MKAELPVLHNDSRTPRNATPTVEQMMQAAQLLREALALLEAGGVRPTIAAFRSGADRLLRLPEVEHLTGLSRSTIYDQMQRGIFPKSVKVGPRAATWSQAAIQTWIANRLKNGMT